MEEERKKSFLEELQSLDESAKKKILVVATVIIMVVVIYVWFAYFNSLIAGTVPQAAIAEDQAANQSAGSASVWQNVGNGMASIYGYSMNALRGLGNILQAPRQYIIKPPH